MKIFAQRTKVLQISLFAIFSAFIVELIFGLVSNSLALITDSIHALLDSVVTLVLLLAARLAMKPPDAEHTYGHGKIESLGGLIGGIAIFLIACFFIYESINRLQSPPPSVLPGLFAIIGGLYTIGIDFFRIILLRKSIKAIGGTTLKADFYHAFMDLGSTSVAIIGIILVTYGIYFGRFCCSLDSRRIISNSQHKIDLQNCIRFDRCNIARTCKKSQRNFKFNKWSYGNRINTNEKIRRYNFCGCNHIITR